MATGDQRSAEATGLPEFILVGAPKCGTTSLHAMLALHPDVFIPEYEVFFFDVDDIMVHPDFFFHRDGSSFHDYEGEFEEYLAWYRSLFVDAQPGQLIGEDTTTYLCSPYASSRIAKLLPDVKLIALLRDPVDRAYSQYFHNVRAGRHSVSFERTLRTNPGALLMHGFYYEQLERYRGFMDAGQMLVLFFEDFAADPTGLLRQVCDFLDLQDLPPASAEAQHSNRAHPPLNLRARLFVNHWLGHLFSFPRTRPNLPGYRGPDAPNPQARPLRPHERAILSLDERFPRPPPAPMSATTREVLQKVFAKRNAGLADLLGCDVSARWPYMR